MKIRTCRNKSDALCVGGYEVFEGNKFFFVMGAFNHFFRGRFYTLETNILDRVVRQDYAFMRSIFRGNNNEN